MITVNLIKPNGFKSLGLYTAQATVYWFLNGQKEILDVTEIGSFQSIKNHPKGSDPWINQYNND